MMKMNTLFNDLKNEIKQKASPEKAKILSGFFKTGKGQYGEGDVFLGLTVPEQRLLAKKYQDLSIDDIGELIQNKIHEYRLVALLILVQKFNSANQEQKKKIFEFYVEHKDQVNNWDLVDLSADKIIGAWLINKDKKLIYNLANSENLWDKRIAMISTFYFIKKNKFEDALKIAEILIDDKHDLIQKAVGWMLREIGKRNQEIEEKFLDKHYKIMPRTMLRYSIERFDEQKRKHYMNKD